MVDLHISRCEQIQYVCDCLAAGILALGWREGTIFVRRIIVIRPAVGLCAHNSWIFAGCHPEQTRARILHAKLLGARLQLRVVRLDHDHS